MLCAFDIEPGLGSEGMTMYRFLAGLCLAWGLAACSNSAAAPRSDAAAGAARAAQSARIVNTSAPLECVPFARRVSGIGIRGDAWTWWKSAAGRYQRRSQPEVGAVLVLRKSNRLRGGHLAVVTQVVDRRTILVRHANWLNRGRIHESTPVRDVSAKGDWSAVRIWYTPGRSLGRRSYPAYGFISPAQPSA